MTTIEVFGARVRQARILRRMTGKAVMDAMGWKGARQTRLEQSATTALDTADAVQLAEVLRFPVDFLTSPPLSKVTPQDLLFRAPKSTSVLEQEYMAQFAAVAGDVMEVLQTRWQLPPVKLPTLRQDTDPTEAARRTRKALSLPPDQPIGNLMYEIENRGVAVVLRSRRTKSSGELAWDAEEPRERHVGFSTRVGEFGDRPLIVVRALESWERTRWTVAHELGHLVLHADGVDREDQEEQASRFASELLAPSEVIAGEVPALPTLVNLMSLKSKWGISLGALVRHLHDSQLIDTRRYDMLRKQLYTRVNPDTGHTWGRTEPGWDERDPERPRLLAKWMEQCFGATSVAMLATRDANWPDGHAKYPQDLLDDLFAGQRRAPSASGQSAAPRRTTDVVTSAVPPARALTPMGGDGGNVIVDFDRFRRQRRA